MTEANKQVHKDTVVSVDYTVKLDSGEVVDSSAESRPLEYLHGHKNIIPGLEAALEGMEVGESKHVTVAPADAYGERVEEAMEWFPRNAFPADVELAPGMMFQAHDAQGNVIMLVVREVEDDRVLVDYNHPLAGQTLHFDVTVVDIRPATADEIAHGHVHHAEHH